MRNTTRYLCAAAYLDDGFRDRVIAEYVEDEHRAVAPGGGYDLSAVVRHCLHARRLVLYRDLVLMALIVLALVIAPAGARPALGVLLWTGGLLWARGWTSAARVLTFLFVLWLLYIMLSALAALVFGSFTMSAGWGVRLALGVGFQFFGFLVVVVECGHVVLVYRLMRHTLHPLSAVPAPASPNPRLDGALARLSAAQRGNVSLYSSHPFLGSGTLRKEWAIVLELDRKAPDAPDGAPKVDAARLHARVWQRIGEMKHPDADDPASLAPHESVVGLEGPQMHVVANGRLAQYTRPLGIDGQVVSGHPLVDSAGLPYSRATHEAVEAILTHPQGALRCYQRISVDSRGQLVCARDGAVVSPPEDQDVATTAFLHVAVEGRMLYAQFVATAHTPVAREFKIVDALPSVADRSLAWLALRTRWQEIPKTAALCWSRAFRTLLHMGVAALRADMARPQHLTTYDYGYRICPRELAGSAGYDTYIQLLDTDKYIRLIERRVNEAILDYLSDECGIDVSAYREQMTAITNNSVRITGSTITGSQINTGAGAVQNQTKVS
ncbi:hypothetical protein [Actinocorallia sp. A-T 12471]|uniref:hypothetical protein n=1 Tax=Actinocorallia sp. A-T 12471 TaxID=3089813 RepID=UPI0029CB15DE|nr:hypothetical protein [Actinocorallia sp. A-T 12471]MDX6738464.1 hypothetical protein [Actinocorallia sp. A-T 12471]